MSPVIVVCVIWFSTVVLLGAVAVALANQVRSGAVRRALATRASRAAAASVGSIGRIGTGVIIGLAGWSTVIVVGWIMGIAARNLEGPVDRPAFHWWQTNHLSGKWHDTWWTLTKIGSPQVIQMATVIGMVVLTALYAGRRFWWTPAVLLPMSYVAEFFAQQILKYVAHRGHPPTALGSFPSGGMARVIIVYGLIIYFLIMRLAPGHRRIWAAGGALLAVAASIQAYARLNNLEHWTTDVIAGAVFGTMLLVTFVLVHRAITIAASAAGVPATQPSRQPEPALV
jgi:hypothetical protein